MFSSFAEASMSVGIAGVAVIVFWCLQVLSDGSFKRFMIASVLLGFAAGLISWQVLHVRSGDLMLTSNSHRFGDGVASVLLGALVCCTGLTVLDRRIWAPLAGGCLIAVSSVLTMGVGRGDVGFESTIALLAGVLVVLAGVRTIFVARRLGDGRSVAYGSLVMFAGFMVCGWSVWVAMLISAAGK